MTWKWLFGMLGVTAILLAACSSKEIKAPETDMNTPFVLKVGAGNLDHFYKVYYPMLSEMYPQMQLEITNLEEYINAPEPGETLEQSIVRSYKNYIAKDQPDVLVYSMPDLARALSRAGMIESFDPLLKRDKYATDTMYAPAINTLRAYGDGELYELAPFFTPGE